MKTEEELTKIIKTIVDQHQKLWQICDKVIDCGAIEVDGVFYNTIWSAFEALLNIIQLDLLEDESKWIEWYIYDAKFGTQCQNVTIANGDEIFVDSPEKLAKVILS